MERLLELVPFRVRKDAVSNATGVRRYGNLALGEERDAKRARLHAMILLVLRSRCEALELKGLLGMLKMSCPRPGEPGYSVSVSKGRVFEGTACLILRSIWLTRSS